MGTSALPVLDDKIRLEREIGRGAMGVVWRGRNVALDKSVAVKVLSGALLEAEGSVGRERFEREVRAVARLNSPHIVQVFDYGVAEGDEAGTPYYVMELLEGEDLGQRLDREGRLPLPVVEEIVEQTCRGLAAAHGAGVVHRDLKPANLYLVATPDGSIHLKILDFGVAKQLDGTDGAMTMTQSGTLVGTPYFMSPEQILSPRDIDERTDLWSLAVVAYVALTGTTPFDGETIGALSIAIHGGRFTPPSRLRQELPPAMDAWFSRAFQQMPDDRFDDAEALARSFADATRDRAPHALASTSDHDEELGAAATERHPLVQQRARRRRRRLAAVGLIAAGALGGAFLAQPGGRTDTVPSNAQPRLSEPPVPPPPAPPVTRSAPSAPPSSTASPLATSSPTASPPAPSASSSSPAPRPSARRSGPAAAPPERFKKPIGHPCQADEDCGNKHCSEGVCCMTSCDGPCQKCSDAVAYHTLTPMPDGRCGMARPGTNPRAGCHPLMVCGFTGYCQPRSHVERERKKRADQAATRP